MGQNAFQRLCILFTGFLLFWLVFKYLFPLFLPFLLGAALALAAEPMVKFLHQQLHVPRGVSSAVGVCAVFALAALVLLVLAALAVRELQSLASILPDLNEMARRSLLAAQDWLLSLAAQAPEGLGQVLTDLASQLLSGGSTLLASAAEWLLSTATGLLGKLPGGAMGLGTGILSAFMISAKLPSLRDRLSARVPQSWRQQYLPAVREIRRTVGSWLKAQAKLAGLTFLIVTAGLLLLRVPYAPLLAALIALVDAVPMLGTGTVMIPWALVCFLQDNRLLGIGLLGTYAVAALTRSILEPRLVGRHLGLDPLATLLALYLGFRLWGVLGMIFAPMAAVVVFRLIRLSSHQESP